jgi:hypothetical protein
MIISSERSWNRNTSSTAERKKIMKSTNPEDIIKGLEWTHKLPNDGGTWGAAVREAAAKGAEIITGYRTQRDAAVKGAKDAMKDLKKLMRHAPFDAKIHGFAPDAITAAIGEPVPAPAPAPDAPPAAPTSRKKKA